MISMNVTLSFVMMWLLVGAAPRTVKDASITVTVTPYFCLAPCTIRIDLIIPQQPTNRWAVVELDGPTFRSSRVQLEGELAPRHFTFTYEVTTAGDYIVKGVLYNTTREVNRQVRQFVAH